ncbi:MAG: hypothetical protein DRP91_00095 [Candidatus Neomarinimicrobiota bacterium]|nr:hypothetical protein [Candidatus Neomarinimicrobiota bacterium]MCD6099900.1 hypothetical protein [Candidatus Neomarinimicrobiota bacterium]RKY50980.1 MAG: hypothetical protein DRP91_00095 [Candidatus Neomarinimicrobiota bacterium]HDN58379.1 hypothetical protein [Candidatus Neomarinimicrobiota bacterium]
MSIKVFATKDILNDRWAIKILGEHSLSYELIDSEDEIHQICPGSDPKTSILLTRSKGEVVKNCPGTQESYLCCGYKVINQTLNCPMECTYCILQYYLNQPATVVYTDFDRIFSQVDSLLKNSEGKILRIGTGELSDSLALPGSIIFAREAIKFFSSKKDVFFELKTKTVNVNSLIGIHHGDNIVISWSLNPDPVIAKEEKKASSLRSRIDSARKAMEDGYLVGFHFDPIILHNGWEENYREIVHLIYENIPPERIAWISLGSLRFPPTTKEKIARRHPETRIIFQEMIKGLDGKLRYPRPLRVKMYRLIFEELKKVDNPPFIYFCMESQSVWKDVTGITPQNNKNFEFIFARSLFERFPELKLTPPREEIYLR